tara:strand:+ start:240 stop:545 length:306 start_codon:yes stop_codon:yes gene_type:complete
MLKKYFSIFLPLVLGGFVLYGTNPNYKEHEAIVALTCDSKGIGENTTMCPLGYGKKSAAGFDKKEFKVYSAGILSYSTYEEKFSSIGILGNVFLTMDDIEA